ncbi:MAG TPA: HAMP domain-containing sensor histidine kinase [Pyrinomonadaceae bacterium]
MLRPSSKAPSTEYSKVLNYSYLVLSIMLLLTAGATLVYYQNSTLFADDTGARWTPVVFLVGFCISLVIFAITHREATARLVLQQKTADLIEAQKLNGALLEAEQNSRIAAERANRAKDEFLAVVSHELRTPLNAIAGWTRILRTRGVSDETRERALGKIEKNLRIQTAIVEELLSFSDVVSSSPHTLNKTVVMQEVFEDAVAAVRPAAFQKGVTLACDDRLNGERVLGDRGRLKIALLNVLTNAVKFTPSGGNIQTEAYEHEGFIKCVIRDSGSGIPPEFLPHVFDQYSQLEHYSTRHYGGLGLGLTIAQHIIKLHNGTIDAESAGEGEGSTFTITIPSGTPKTAH